VWCPPDSSLFNSTTLKPLIAQSLRHRLPIVGFSSGFVRAGAVAGAFPDFRDVGEQTAELAGRFLSGQPIPANERPRKLRIGINLHVARLFGVRYRHPSNRFAELALL